MTTQDMGNGMVKLIPAKDKVILDNVTNRTYSEVVCKEGEKNRYSDV